MTGGYRVGIDVSCLDVARTGVRTYVEELSCALARETRFDVVPLRPRKTASAATLASKVSRQVKHQWWMQVGLPSALARHRCDVLLGPEYEVPLRAPCARVVVFHDANFWINPGQYNPLWRGVLNALSVPAARQAERVITVSEYARRDLIEHLSIEPARIVAIPEAPKSLPDPAPSEVHQTLASYGLTAGSYLLHVGVLERRKNLPFLAEAFARVASELPVQLVLAGQPAPKRAMDDSERLRETVMRLGLADRVLMTGFVDDRALAALYRGALASVFPSLMEGFGLPVLEAFAQGTPLLCARSTALPEVAADAALYFSPHSVDELVDAIRRVAADAELRAQLRSRGLARISGYSWAETARKTAHVLEEAIECFTS